MMLKDVRYALRMLRKNPGFTAVAICSLAIGIGATSAIYTLADGLLLRPIPVPKPSEVVTVRPLVTTGTFGVDSTLSYPDYVDLRDRNQSFEGLWRRSILLSASRQIRTACHGGSSECG
jgi:putative ABC transport system permease protein